MRYARKQEDGDILHAHLGLLMANEIFYGLNKYDRYFLYTVGELLGIDIDLAINEVQVMDGMPTEYGERFYAIDDE